MSKFFSGDISCGYFPIWPDFRNNFQAPENGFLLLISCLNFPAGSSLVGTPPSVRIFEIISGLAINFLSQFSSGVVSGGYFPIFSDFRNSLRALENGSPLLTSYLNSPAGSSLVGTSTFVRIF